MYQEDDRHDMYCRVEVGQALILVPEGDLLLLLGTPLLCRIFFSLLMLRLLPLSLIVLTLQRLSALIVLYNLDYYLTSIHASILHISDVSHAEPALERQIQEEQETEMHDCDESS